MLNGIGGRTIAEAKERMLLREYRQWVKYRSVRGSLAPSRRLEQSLARVCHLICVAAGIKKDQDAGTTFSIEDFMPHEDSYLTRESEMTLEEYVNSARD